jgi:hypothetical protein
VFSKISNEERSSVVNAAERVLLMSGRSPEEKDATASDGSRGLTIFIGVLMFGVWLLVLGAHL